MEERVKFIRDYRSGEHCMSELCRIYGISRKSGYKWVDRAELFGLSGLADRSRAPINHPNAIVEATVEFILDARGLHPTWGPKKLLAWLEARHPGRYFPCPSTIGEILKRHGLSAPRRRRRRAEPSSRPFADCSRPNHVWCADFKGWFKTGDGKRVDPLTISDAASRYFIRCQAMRRVRLELVQSVFEASFRELGLPGAIRTDNGSPFASHGTGGLSRLSAWWIRLGIKPERIEPGKPQQNGRHERIHLTLKQETASPPERNLRAQQRAFDRFRKEYNNERPHEALGQVPPASVYEPSPREFPSRLPAVEYPDTMVTRKVQCCGEFHWRGKKVFLTEALIGQVIGFEPVDDGKYDIYFSDYPVGVFDERRFKVNRIKRSV